VSEAAFCWHGARHPSLIEDPSALKQDIPGAADARDERARACSLLVGDAAGGRWRRDNELPVDDLGTNRRCSPSAVCPLAFCAGGLRGAQRQNGDEREEKARADAEPMAAKPHLTRMARGQSSRIGRSAHLQLRQVLFSGRQPWPETRRALAPRPSPRLSQRSRTRLRRPLASRGEGNGGRS
jgi:hypothetical protein